MEFGCLCTLRGPSDNRAIDHTPIVSVTRLFVRWYHISVQSSCTQSSNHLERAVYRVRHGTPNVEYLLLDSEVSGKRAHELPCPVRTAGVSQNLDIVACHRVSCACRHICLCLATMSLHFLLSPLSWCSSWYQHKSLADFAIARCIAVVGVMSSPSSVAI